MTSKSRVDSHVITEKESERKDNIKAAGTTLFTNPMGQFSGQLNNKAIMRTWLSHLLACISSNPPKSTYIWLVHP
mgnify:CR=1 FL=1